MTLPTAAKQMAEARPIANRSSEELAMRALIVPELRKRYPSARVIHELPLRYSSNRIDLAAVTETQIISVEVKSSRDVVDRLEAQVRAFLPVSSRIIVALAPRWNEQLESVAEQINHPKIGRYTRYQPRYTEAQALLHRIARGGIEMWTVDADAGSVIVTDHVYRDRRPWLSEMLHMLHVSELVEIAGRHRCWQGKRPVHDDLVATCTEMMTGREISHAVCEALRARPAFAAQSDAPIAALARYEALSREGDERGK